MKIKTVILITLSVITISCSSEDTSGNLSIKATAKYYNVKVKSNTTNVELSKFMINIREIELEYDNDLEDGNEDINDEQLYADVEFEGPFELDLLTGSTQVNVSAANVPIGKFEEIEFDMSPSRDETSELIGKSILVEGLIDGKPFIFWHNTDEEFEVDYANASNDIVMSGGGATIVINFDLNIIFGATSSIDFSSATDGDGDGVIEIYPGDNDGNSHLADTIKNLLHEGADLLDD